MTVKELIEKLRELPSDKVVTQYDLTTVDFVEFDEQEDAVILA